MKTKIFIQRHGESEGNANQLYLGHTDLPLTAVGLKQARLCAEYLKDEKIDAIYSSDLIRASHTAEPHARLRGMEVVLRRELRELNVGLWENRRIDDIIAEWGDEFLVGWRQNYGTFCPPGGEAVLDGGKRFFKELVRIAKAHPGEVVLIASHAAVIRASWGLVSNIPPEDMGRDTRFPTNASVTRIEFDGERLIPIEYSSDSHIKSAGLECR
jgi:broad specificity phosphatase PhoE